MTDERTPPEIEYITGVRREEPAVDPTFTVTEAVAAEHGKIAYTVKNIGMKAGECEVWAKGTNETIDGKNHVVDSDDEQSGTLEIEGDIPATEFRVVVAPVRDGSVAKEDSSVAQVLSEQSDSYYDDEETIREDYAGSDDLFPSEREQQTGARREDQAPIERLKGLEQPEVKTSPIDEERDRFRDLERRLENAGEDLLYPFDREYIAGVRRSTPDRPKLAIADFEYDGGSVDVEITNPGDGTVEGPVWAEDFNEGGWELVDDPEHVELEPNESATLSFDTGQMISGSVRTPDDVINLVTDELRGYQYRWALWDEYGSGDPIHALAFTDILPAEGYSSPGHLVWRFDRNRVFPGDKYVGNLRTVDGEIIEDFSDGLGGYDIVMSDDHDESDLNITNGMLHAPGGVSATLTSYDVFEEIRPGRTYLFDVSVDRPEIDEDDRVATWGGYMASFTDDDGSDGVDAGLMFFQRGLLAIEEVYIDLTYKDTFYQPVDVNWGDVYTLEFELTPLPTGTTERYGGGWELDEHHHHGRAARFKHYHDALLFDEIGDQLESVVEPQQWIECTVVANESHNQFDLQLINLETEESESLPVDAFVTDIPDEIGFLELAGWTLSEGDRVRDVSITVDGETESWSTADEFDEWEPGYHDGQQNQWEYVNDGDGYLELQTAPTEKSLRTTDVYFDPEESIEASFTAWTADERMSHSRLLLG